MFGVSIYILMPILIIAAIVIYIMTTENGEKKVMSNIKKLSEIIASKVNKLLGIIENPCEQLDYSYEKQKELLENVKKGIVELTSSKKQLELQKFNISKDLEKLDKQAQMCMNQGNEPLAKIALERKVNTQKQIASLTDQITQLDLNQKKLIEASKALEMKIDQLKSEKETVKAQYEAAKASLKINESLSGMGNDLGNIGTAMDNARDKTDQMNSKSSAINDLAEAGVLSDSLGGNSNSIDRELDKAQSKGQVDDEFNKMKKAAMLKNNDLNYFKVK
jgi:phage shock protein A